jgi:hypothetical protein
LEYQEQPGFVMSSSSQRELSSATSSGENDKTLGKSSGRVRFNLEIADSVADKIKDLQTRTASESKTEVIRKALALFHLFVEERDAGTSIIFRRRNGKEETLKVLL